MLDEMELRGFADLLGRWYAEAMQAATEAGRRDALAEDPLSSGYAAAREQWATATTYLTCSRELFKLLWQFPIWRDYERRLGLGEQFDVLHDERAEEGQP